MRRQELVGITLALSLGLSAQAWAASPASLTKSVVFRKPNPVFGQLLQLPASPRHADPNFEYQYLAMAGNAANVDGELLAYAKAPAKKSRPAQSAAVSGPPSLVQGVAYYNRGYIAKGIPLLEKATQQAPQSEMAFLWLARARQKQGTPADQIKAKSAFQKVLNINPNNLEALSQLGEMWSWDPAMRAEAVTLLKHAYDLNPNDASISRKLAEALFWQGNAMDALRYAAPVANLYKNDKKWMADYAQMLSNTGHAEEALEIYNTVLKSDSQKSLILRLEEAKALYKSGQRQSAQAIYEEVCQSVAGTPMASNVDFIQSISGLAFDLGLYSDSLKWDQSLPESAQRLKDVQIRQARALTHVSRGPEAIDQFNRLYEAGLLNTDEKLEFASYLRSLNLPADALPTPGLIETLYKEAVQEAPDSPEVAVSLARMYAEQDGHFEDALKSYQQALGSSSLLNRESVKKEYLDFLKSDKTQPLVVENLFKQMLAESPDDIQAKAAYAEFLSWQTDRRAEALRMYVELGNADADNRDVWESHIEEVLKWHKPSTAMIPLYQDIVNLYPQNKMIWLAVARAYRGDKNYYKEAVDTYSTLVKRFPDDGTIKREWLGLLVSNPSQRDENIRMLKKMTDEDPGDLDVLATYGKLLSYDHKYGPAMNAFETVLEKNPEHREALVGKGYVILWSGRKLEAKRFFQDLRAKYPDDVDIAIGLAQTDKLIGRYDEAMKVIQEIKPLMDQNGQKLPESSDAYDLNADFVLVDNQEIASNPYGRNLVSDVSVLPVEAEQAKPVEVAASTDEEVRSLQAEVDALSDAVNTLKLLQQSSKSQIDKLDQAIRTTKDAVPYAMSLQPADDGNGYGNGSRVASMSGAGMGGYGAGHPGGGHSVGESGMTPAYGTYTALDYDTNPLLSGLGRFRNDDLTNLEKGLTNDLRPMMRAGFLYSRQGGESTTTRLSSWGFPNQVALSLTPQVRVRGGIKPTRYFLPNGVSPDSTWGVEYAMGATVKYWDRLTLDGDLAITHFTQSKSENLTFQTQAQYDFTDSIRAKIGVSRLPQYNSLLAWTGLKPSLGAFAGNLVGQSRENSIYGELNLHPFSQNIDWNLGYSWAFIDGSHIPKNYKNQAFTSLGYTWHYSPNHQMRLGYEFLYFGYSKNATNGFFDTTAAGNHRPVAKLDPVVLANSAYVFGGYFSPSVFIMNAGRLDFQGSLFNKFLEYKLGGSLGAQTVFLGHSIKEAGNRTSLSSAFDANLIMNFTDWLAAYGDVDFLDAGGQFNRWRFGGGLIVRPHINALSPVFGDHASGKAKASNQ